MSAISLDGDKADIDAARCAECEICVRVNACPLDALEPAQNLEWPRSIRSIFSNPFSEYSATGVTGRGTEEMKTNDVTNRFKHGEIGVAIDVGRPSVGTTLREVEKLSKAVAALGVEFEPANPLTALMVDTSDGSLKPEVLDENVISAIIEFKVPSGKLTPVLDAIRQIEDEVRTVFSVGVICRVEDDGGIPILPVLRERGWNVRPNGKTNVGLGRI